MSAPGLLPVADALARIAALVTPTETETVPLARAAGRVLAEDAVARRDQPPFAASAMDGYAVRAAEAVTGASLRVAGEAAAGRGHAGGLPAGAAIRIFTGAPLPEGADAILIQENAAREADRITVREPPAAGAHIRPARADFAAGDRLEAPRRLSPRDVALLAAMNVAEVRVARRPAVALVPTGDELVEPGETPGPHEIVTSNNFGLAAMLARIGAEPRMLPIARDNRENLMTALDGAEGADLLVTLGGASVGEHDLVARVLGEAGLSLDFYKIAMRPGKPLMAGRMGAMAMLGLPGNPVSAIVCGEVFLRPAVERALGLPGGRRATVTARLTHDLGANGPREHYMRARFVEGDDGIRRVEVFSNQDSSLLATLSRADALALRAPGAPPAPAGTPLPCIPLD
jgi:molybdopterin molybdotransferase